MPSGVYTRTKPRSFEVRKRISETLKGRTSPMKGRTQSLLTRQKMSEIRKGKKPYEMTDEVKRKISETKTGTSLSVEHKAKISSGEKKGIDHHMWKGDKVGYYALHAWVRRNLGTPSECSECGFTSDNRRQFHWANISHEYKRDLDDWARLCVMCHKAYDSNKLILMQERG